MSSNSPHLEIVQGANLGQFLSIPEHGARIGRAPENDIKLDDAALSRFQCRLFFRDGGLWIADLGSTNATLVNHQTVQESMLRSNDVITIGETDIKVIRSRLLEAEPEPRTSVIVSRPVSDNELDLGLDQQAVEEAAAAGERRHVPGFLWIIAAAAVLLALLLILPKILKDMSGSGPEPVVPLVAANQQPLQFEYEKVLASNDNIYRFALNLQNTRTINEKIVHKLRDDLEATPFFSSRSEYTSRSSDTYESVDLSISVGPKTHRARARNQLTLPDDISGAIEIIDAFAETEFGLKALSQPPEKLKELARTSFQTGLKKWSERSASHGNLWDSIKDLEQVEYYLETIDEKPDYYREARELLQQASGELKDQVENLNFQVEKARQTRQWEKAADTLRTICLIIPDRTDPRHQDAQTLLNQVQQRIPR